MVCLIIFLILRSIPHDLNCKNVIIVKFHFFHSLDILLMYFNIFIQTNCLSKKSWEDILSYVCLYMHHFRCFLFLHVGVNFHFVLLPLTWITSLSIFFLPFFSSCFSLFVTPSFSFSVFCYTSAVVKFSSHVSFVFQIHFLLTPLCSSGLVSLIVRISYLSPFSNLLSYILIQRHEEP